MRISIDKNNQERKPNQAEVIKISQRLPYSNKVISGPQELASLVIPPHSYSVAPAIFGMRECEYLENANWDTCGDNKETKDYCERTCSKIKDCDMHDEEENKYGKIRYAFLGDGRIRRRIKNWVGQQFFFLDIDCGISHEDFLQRCNKYDVNPAFTYETFSSKNMNRFRAVFVLDHELCIAVPNSKEAQNVVQVSLRKLFPESDKISAVSIFHGGKGLLHEDYQQTINICNLVMSTVHYIEYKDYKNSARNVAAYCKKAGIALVNNTPHIEMGVPHFEDNEHPLLYIYRRCSLSSNYIPPKLICDKIHLAEHVKSYNSHANVAKDVNKYTGRAAKIDFYQLEKGCRLFKDWSNGVPFQHNDALWLAHQLSLMEDGKEKIKAGLAKGAYHKPGKLINDIEYHIRKKQQPTRCENYCTYAPDCCHDKNILTTFQIKSGKVYTLEKQNFLTLQNTEQNLKDAYAQALKTSSDSITVIRADAGIGKTEIYLDVDTALICAPTHALKNEIYKRFRLKGKTVKVTPMLPIFSVEHNSAIKKLYRVGAYKFANSYIKQLAQDGVESAKNYLEKLKTAKKWKGITITTHDMFLFWRDIPQDTIIIDEDIFSKLLHTGFCKFDDLCKMVGCLDNTYDKDNMQAIVDYIQKASYGRIVVMMNYLKKRMFKLEEAVGGDTSINTNVIGFMLCDYWMKVQSNNGIDIHFLSRRELPVGKRIIILSATINKIIWDRLYPEKLNFIDTGNTQPKGRIIQYTNNSFSRSQLKNNQNHLKLAQAMAFGKKVITYKEFEKYFDYIAHFQALEGLDKFSGDDLYIVGTPHLNPIVYLLYSAVFDVTESLSLDLLSLDLSERMKVQWVTYNGKRFKFNTFSNKKILQDLQLYMIESQLLQAVGRARILRNDCTVTLLSNLPISGAEYRQLSKKEKDELIKEYDSRKSA